MSKTTNTEKILKHEKFARLYHERGVKAHSAYIQNSQKEAYHKQAILRLKESHEDIFDCDCESCVRAQKRRVNGYG